MSGITHINNTKILFIHFPKTGGISISKALGIPIDHIPRSYFNCDCFSFGFVRNPWDRLVSAFHYLSTGGINEFDHKDRDTYLVRYKDDFASFVKGELDCDNPKVFEQQHLKPQYLWLTDKNEEVKISFIGKFERLESDFQCICKQLSITPPILPHLNKSDHRDYRTYYDPETIEIVGRAYSKDCELFNYVF